MPGTDMCIKIGGWVRAEVSWGVNGNSTTGSFGSDYNNRYTNNFWTRERGYITADAREQTAYGVARGYIAVGIASQNQGNEVPASQANINRAFVQWAGFTAGQSVSFFDFYPAAAQLYRAGNLPSEDSGDGGWWVWGYTAQFGGGFSATLSAEERRDSQILDFGGTPASGAATPGGRCFRYSCQPRGTWWPNYAGHQWPFRWLHRWHLRVRRLAAARHRRQSARRPGLGQCASHGRPA